MRWGNAVAATHRLTRSAIESLVERCDRSPLQVLLEPRDPWQEVAWKGLSFLLAQARSSFREARHAMFLPRFLDFTGDRDVYYGDVFQRALIADVLCDADDVLGGALHPLIESEVDYLVDCRRRNGFGGWSYFPDLPELAPDADDLGQIVQVLVRTRRRDSLREHASEPLRVLFADCGHEDGSFERWIVPSRNRDPLQERQFAVAQARWGTGADPEVVANLLYGLVLYHAGQYADVCRRGARYLVGAQHPDGSWMCRWYFGPYYGTYACMRFLRAASPDSPSLARAADFVRDRQNSDGSWSLSQTRNGDPLSTALALLALTYAPGAASETDRQRAVRARLALGSQTTKRSWASWPFIKPSGVHSYGSRTITTAFVTKAALAWSQRDGDRATSPRVPPSPGPGTPAPR